MTLPPQEEMRRLIIEALQEELDIINDEAREAEKNTLDNRGFTSTSEASGDFSKICKNGSTQA